ncbi:hypothetical protein RGI99_000802 [Morganella morganii]|uniref:hypothetical protein n=1 Tax=Morganella morganii TaxID=582 RepID=UPI0005FB8B9F|nr:hypothetical protein [Morganella morganii]DAP51175.1 MAG TPA: hypothetical protein [Caudoviricetes sp.]ELA7678351.1 hypothetical protein [Morganella morganii]ELA7730795.1 hypothetical protein [Morganella morganii]KJY06340.1 hypothetical protein Mm0Y_00187 [Morganella morganii]HCD1105356.1 hypothetical protein [Morganella morganii]
MKGKGTTLTDLNKAYSKQGRYIAARYVRARIHFFKDKTDSAFFECYCAAEKHQPRGRAYQRIISLENAANTRRFAELQRMIKESTNEMD